MNEELLESWEEMRRELLKINERQAKLINELLGGAWAVIVGDNRDMQRQTDALAEQVHELRQEIARLKDDAAQKVSAD